MANLIAKANQSQLAIIDVQTKLCSVMSEADMQAVTRNCSNLTQAAKMLAIPMIVTEQYPEGLGNTTPEIAQYIGNVKPIAKTAFSACAAPKFKAQLQRDKSQIILAGLEAHICVLQTALDLIAQGKQVFVVEDAIISRDAENKRNAIARLAGAGCIVTNTESVLFEWLGNASHEAFKDVSRLIK
ncbi:MAG: isochorismatase family protein [Methylophilaceae bacterium]